MYYFFICSSFFQMFIESIDFADLTHSVTTSFLSVEICAM